MSPPDHIVRVTSDRFFNLRDEPRPGDAFEIHHDRPLHMLPFAAPDDTCPTFSPAPTRPASAASVCRYA